MNVTLMVTSTTPIMSAICRKRPSTPRQPSAMTLNITRPSAELAARASTDWVFINTTTGRPAPIPPKIAAAYLPEGEGESEAVRQRFPGLPMPPPGIFSLRRRVEWRDIDAEQHVNNAIYL